MKIELEIYNDELIPVTCARDFRDGRYCQFIRTKRFGTEYHCLLFEKQLENYEDNPEKPFVPCGECFEARKK